VGTPAGPFGPVAALSRDDGPRVASAFATSQHWNERQLVDLSEVTKTRRPFIASSSHVVGARHSSAPGILRASAPEPGEGSAQPPQCFVATEHFERLKQRRADSPTGDRDTRQRLRLAELHFESSHHFFDCNLQ
jgi:hypothetical protein